MFGDCSIGCVSQIGANKTPDRAIATDLATQLFGIGWQSGGLGWDDRSERVPKGPESGPCREVWVALREPPFDPDGIATPQTLEQ